MFGNSIFGNIFCLYTLIYNILYGIFNLISAAEKVREEQNNSVQTASADISAEEIEALIVERKEAKKAKNFARADEIRQYLSDKGVTLIDTREGTTYKIG